MFTSLRYSWTLLLAVILYVSFPLVVRGQIAPTNTATISGSVSDSSGKPVANATVSLSGAKHAVTHTDANGLFVFIGIPFGTYQLSAQATDFGIAVRAVSVEGDINVAITYESPTNGLKTIADVSSSANAHFNVTSASITQVSPISSAFEGITSWRKILEQIPGIAQTGLLNGLGNFSAVPDGPMEPMDISINGTLPYETATLLDDMPLISGSLSGNTHAGGGTNLGVYALNGFASADVVRGPGASAPSIVDSIGGSFVLHTPGAVNQNHTTISVSTDPYGGIVANALDAVRWGKLSAVLTYGVNDSPGPTNAARVPAVDVFTPTTINGAAFQCTGSCSSGYLLSPNYAPASFPYYGFTNGLLFCCYQATTAWSQQSGSLSLHYQLSPSMTAEVFYSGQTTHEPSSYPDMESVFMPPSGYTGSLAAGDYFSSLSYICNDLYLYHNSSSLLEEKLDVQLGLGTLQVAALQNRVWDVQVGSSPASTTEKLFGGGSLCSNTSLNCGTGTYMPAIFNGSTYSVGYTPINFQRLQATNNRDLLFEYTTPLGENFHAGVSFSQSYYDYPCTVVESSSVTNIYNYNAMLPAADSGETNESRLFVGGTSSEKTSVDLSMYFANADYHMQNPADATGNTYIDERYTYAAPRLGFVWRPMSAVAVRAAAGGGFAEAPLSDLTGSCGFVDNGAPTLGPGYYTETLTNVNLRPEKSFGFDLGTDIRLHRNTLLSVDLYHTNLYGQFYQSTDVSGTYLGLPLFITQYGNLGESRYEGVLVDVRHDSPHGIYWSVSGGLTRGYVVNVPPGFYNTASGVCNVATGANCTNVAVVPGINFNGAFTGAPGVNIPYAQGLGQMGYRWLSNKYIDLTGTYYGSNNTYFRPAFVEFDGNVSYPVTRNTSLLVTFRNITGIYDLPTQVISNSDLAGAPTITGLPYPLYGQEYGPRTVILTLRTDL